MDTAGTLQEMTQNFQTKIDKGYTLTVQLDIQGESVSWHIAAKNEKVIVDKGSCTSPISF